MKVTEVMFDGLKAHMVECPGIELIVVSGSGPRIASLSRPGESSSNNLLYWDYVGTKHRGGWRLLGGHRVWVWMPGADESEQAYLRDNEPCGFDVAVNRLRVAGGIDPVMKIRRGMDITEAEAGPGCVEVENWVENCGDMLWSGGVWSLTCTDPRSKRYQAPLGSRHLAWDGFKMYVPMRWAGHTSPVNDPQFVLSQDLLFIEPVGTESKRMIEVAQGWMSCHYHVSGCGCCFFKMAKFRPEMADRYPHGCNAAWYIGPDNFMVEMEWMFPWQTLKPGERMYARERWVLTDHFPTGNDSLGAIRKMLEPYLKGL